MMPVDKIDNLLINNFQQVLMSDVEIRNGLKFLKRYSYENTNQK